MAVDEMVSVLMKENDRLKAALWKYGKHLAVCPLWSKPDERCTCGWVDVREKLAPTPSTRGAES